MLRRPVGDQQRPRNKLTCKRSRVAAWVLGAKNASLRGKRALSNLFPEPCDLKNTREAERSGVLAVILPIVAREQAHVPLGSNSLIFSTQILVQAS
jgi:hypothetical protein